jgi:pre-rRNA-processing protein IPI1
VCARRAEPTRGPHVIERNADRRAALAEPARGASYPARASPQTHRCRHRTAQLLIARPGPGAMGGKLPKKKKPGVGVDFKKVKHKVGKKLPRAQNETNTNFTARAINLPNQSVNDDKTGAAVNARNLTLKVGRARHRGSSSPGKLARAARADPRSTKPGPARRRSCWARRRTTATRRARMRWWAWPTCSPATPTSCGATRAR